MEMRGTGDHVPARPRRTDIECARTYGVEARCHHFDQDWDDVRAALAAGWGRVRGHGGPDWATVESDVRAAWQSATPRER